MQWFYNLKIAKKLIIGFVIVAFIAGAIGIFGIVKINTINDNDTILYEQNTKPLGNLAQIGTQFQRIRVNVRNVILDAENAKDYTTKIEQFYRDINGYIKEYEKGISSSEERKETDNLIALIEKQKPLSEKVVTLAMTNQKEQAEKVLLNEVDPVVREVEALIAKLLDYNVELGAKVSKNNDNQASSTEKLMVVIVAFAVLLSIGIGLFIARIISKPVIEMAQAADKLALGDVSVNVESNTNDEIGRLAESFSRMIENIRNQALVVEKIADGDLTVDVDIRSEKDLLGKKLAELVQKNNVILSNIASASEQVAGGSKQVSDSSTTLSQGATEQASSVEELTASLEEISSQTKLNADNANQANELAEKAKANAIEGNNQMKEMVQAMVEINESSAKISKVIKVIDDIAFQTNILALNAAVEAARAGQHGKGFAVVAEEVRNLAARSANAAKETTEMIEGSIKKTEGGTKIAKDTAQALDKIVTEIEKVANIVNDITVASNEQASGIAQINQGIMQVSQVIQANSATSEESAAASEELSGQAELLKEMVNKFKLKQSTMEYNKFDELSPEVIKMLENLSEKKKTNTGSVVDGRAETAVSKHKIPLSDNDFGKY